jgi:hypothetical protein
MSRMKGMEGTVEQTGSGVYDLRLGDINTDVSVGIQEQTVHVKICISSTRTAEEAQTDTDGDQ